MAIVAGDIEYRLSGGSGNTDPDLALGGAKSSTVVPADQFDDVSSGEAAAGDIEYRCFYIHNAHATLTYQSAVLWIQTNTPGTSTTVAVGVGTSAVNGTEQTIANESTAPTGVTLSSTPVDEATSIALGDIPAGQHKAVWIRRTVTAGQGAIADSYTLRTKGDTAP